MRTSIQASVLLHNQPVGMLQLDSNEACSFHLLESYRKAYPRPVLAQRFLDDLDGVWRSRTRSPAWFSNLLPEGSLLELLSRQAGVAPQREFFLLLHLGKDLPGAVSIIADEQFAPTEERAALLEGRRTAQEDWHFSLAGVQLKFSANRDGKGFTIPLSGLGGQWIAKLPGETFAHVPSNEYATMQWAQQSGIEIPNIELVDMALIDGLPPEALQTGEPKAFVIQRFDRQSDGRRVHMEDFAQLLNLYPHDKYGKTNYETLANITLALTGTEGLRQFLRRLVFVIASGNGDAHIKNWSIIYPDGIQAALSPAYDLVSTIQYMPADKLALNFGGTKDWYAITLDTFRRLARKLRQEESWVIDEVRSSIEAIQSAWHQHSKSLGHPEAVRQQIQRHLDALPLMRI